MLEPEVDFDVIFKPEERENYGNRKDDRTDEETAENLSTGINLQEKLFHEFVSRYLKFLEEYSQCPLKILDYKYLANTEINKGYYEDSLDAKILFCVKNKPPFWQKIEIEAVPHNTRFARFKKTKILMCIEKKVPIIHFQLGIKVPKMYVFSPSDLIIMDKIGYMIDKGYIGNKEVYRFDTSSPGPFLGVEWPSLNPFEVYKKCLGKIVNL